MRFIPYFTWNQQAVDKLAQGIALQGVNTLVTISPLGRILSVTGKGLWQHPWFTEPRWNASLVRWEVRINPTGSFVNGMDPSVPGVPRSETDPSDSDLVDNPLIPVHAFRSVPSEGDPVPGFFKALGVQTPKSNLTISEVGGVVADESGDLGVPLPPRALMAVDFYIAVARATYESHATEVDATGASGVVVDYSVSYNTDRLAQIGSRPRFLQSPLFPAIRTPTLAERLLGTFQDEGEDRQLISTLYLLSPENELAGPPDGRWTPYVKHSVFWPLDHAARNIPPAKPPQPIRLFTGLLGGLGDIIGNQILSGSNEYSERVINAVNTTNNAGVFWSS